MDVCEPTLGISVQLLFPCGSRWLRAFGAEALLPSARSLRRLLRRRLEFRKTAPTIEKIGGDCGVGEEHSTDTKWAELGGEAAEPKWEVQPSVLGLAAFLLL